MEKEKFIINLNRNYNNKLDCKVFSEMRLFDNSKGQTYRKGLEKIFTIMVNRKVYCRAKLISHKVKRFCDIDYSLLCIDTGLTDVEEILNLFEGFYSRNLKNTSKFFLLTFEVVI